MTFNEIWGLSGAMLASLGGGSIIVFSCSSWLGKVWASRIFEAEKYQLQKEMEFYKKNLQKEIETDKSRLQREIEKAKSDYQLEIEKNKAKFLRYSESQFKLYNDLWSSLIELETTADLLWQEADINLILQFRTKLMDAKKALRKGHLHIEDSDYKQLSEVFSRFEQFQFGKLKLINLRNKAQLIEGFIGDIEIQNVINNNFQIKEDYSSLLVDIRLSLKQQISA